MESNKKSQRFQPNKVDVERSFTYFIMDTFIRHQEQIKIQREKKTKKHNTTNIMTSPLFSSTCLYPVTKCCKTSS